ncbi:hypothetical protein EVAR_3311_1 [Eumeta japonica]|uniref:Uncharacterized protein n=1 Tax=Eumeta variegata TaxID=151549 RepID=A0A4C1SYL6_EUMVA|nr:hypothetical protein EVAR_3311_1 [Eumeta japonica]
MILILIDTVLDFGPGHALALTAVRPRTSGHLVSTPIRSHFRSRFGSRFRYRYRAGFDFRARHGVSSLSERGCVAGLFNAGSFKNNSPLARNSTDCFGAGDPGQRHRRFLFTSDISTFAEYEAGQVRCLCVTIVADSNLNFGSPFVLRCDLGKGEGGVVQSTPGTGGV